MQPPEACPGSMHAQRRPAEGVRARQRIEVDGLGRRMVAAVRAASLQIRCGLTPMMAPVATCVSLRRMPCANLRGSVDEGLSQDPAMGRTMIRIVER